jgi:hypothetical protein
MENRTRSLRYNVTLCSTPLARWSNGVRVCHDLNLNIALTEIVLHVLCVVGARFHFPGSLSLTWNITLCLALDTEAVRAAASAATPTPGCDKAATHAASAAHAKILVFRINSSCLCSDYGNSWPQR